MKFNFNVYLHHPDEKQVKKKRLITISIVTIVINNFSIVKIKVRKPEIHVIIHSLSLYITAIFSR